MTFKTCLINLFNYQVLKPQLKQQDRWEKMVVDIPEATRGGENSPLRFNIPREGIKLEGDHPPLPGFPKSAPQMIGSIINSNQVDLSEMQFLRRLRKHILHYFMDCRFLSLSQGVTTLRHRQAPGCAGCQLPGGLTPGVTFI